MISFEYMLDPSHGDATRKIWISVGNAHVEFLSCVINSIDRSPCDDGDPHRSSSVRVMEWCFHEQAKAPKWGWTWKLRIFVLSKDKTIDGDRAAYFL